jgi:hypothetical protein
MDPAPAEHAGVPFPEAHEARGLYSDMSWGVYTYARSAGAQDATNALVLTGNDAAPEWAIYGLDGSVGDPLSVNFSFGEDKTHQAWVALADFTSHRWEYFGPYHNSAAIVLDPLRNKSGDGNVFVAVLVMGSGSDAQINYVQLDSDMNEAPVAKLIATPPAGDPGQEIVLDASGSYDPDGQITRYEWDLTQSGIYEPMPAQVAVTLPDPIGEMKIALRVKDDDGKRTETTLIVGSRSPGWTSWRTEYPSGSAGLFTSLELLNGKPAVVFMSAFEPYPSLYMFRAADSTLDWWTGPNQLLSLLTGGPGNGAWPSLRQLDGCGGMCFYEPILHTLRYIHSYDADGAGWSSPLEIDPAGDTGAPSSLQLVDGRPAVAYFAKPSRQLRYVRALDATGTGWGTPAIVATGANIYTGVSLQVVNGNPAISYSADGTYELLYVRALDADGTAWGGSVVADTTSAGEYPSLQVVNGKPALAYYSPQGSLTDQLKYVRALDANGALWGSPLFLDVMGNPGSYENFVALKVVGGKPGIAYSNTYKADLKYIRAKNGNGTLWAAPETPDSAGLVGSYASLIEVNSQPWISYWDGTNGDLKLAWFTP